MHKKAAEESKELRRAHRPQGGRHRVVHSPPRPHASQAQMEAEVKKGVAKAMETRAVKAADDARGMVSDERQGCSQRAMEEFKGEQNKGQRFAR